MSDAERDTIQGVGRYLTDEERAALQRCGCPCPWECIHGPLPWTVEPAHSDYKIMQGPKLMARCPDRATADQIVKWSKIAPGFFVNTFIDELAERGRK